MTRKDLNKDENLSMILFWIALALLAISNSCNGQSSLRDLHLEQIKLQIQHFDFSAEELSLGNCPDPVAEFCINGEQFQIIRNGSVGLRPKIKFYDSAEPGQIQMNTDTGSIWIHPRFLAPGPLPWKYDSQKDLINQKTK